MKNKELTPLEALEIIYNLEDLQGGRDEFWEAYRIIEKALNDYENLQLKHKSMQEAVLDDSKKLKALEIITEKQVNVRFLSYIDAYQGLSYEDYCFEWERYSDVKLTQDDFDLLKEVLK